MIVGGTNWAPKSPSNQLDEVMKSFNTPAGIRGEYMFCHLLPKSQSMRFVTVTNNSAFHNDTSGSLQAVQNVYFHQAGWDKPQWFGA